LRKSVESRTSLPLVAVGKMLERQVFIYDKRREVIDRHKPIWWDI